MEIDNYGSREAFWETILEVLLRNHGHLDKDGGSRDGRNRPNSIDILEAKIKEISERLDVEDEGEKENKGHCTFHPLGSEEIE